jgi:hypothetical protein
LEKEWDILFILDAARADYYRKFVSKDAEIKYSIGSRSTEFMEKVFIDKELHDTVYLTDNPYASWVESDVFHHMRMVDTAADNDSTSPQQMADKARQVSSEFPNKRLIVHFMQPHQPYYGPSGNDIPQERVWQFIRAGVVSVQQLRDAYRENLEIVSDVALDLADDLYGKTVITSDHGELLGERGTPIPVREFGHPDRHYVPELLKIPWHDLGGERCEVSFDPPITDDRWESDRIESKLEALGYG